MGTTAEKELAATLADAQIDPDRLLTREEAARYLGVHYQTVRDIERSGKLKTEKRDGRPLYRIGDLANYREQHPIMRRPKPKIKVVRERESKVAGERAAEVFALLDAGKDLRDVVRELKVDPDLALRLWQVWRCGSFDALDRDRAARLAEQNADKEARRRERQDMAMFRMLKKGKAGG